MEEFITITDKGITKKQEVKFKRLLAYNGNGKPFTIGIHGETGNWKATETTTGLSVASNHKTLKSIIEQVNELETIIPDYITRQMSWLVKVDTWVL